MADWQAYESAVRDAVGMPQGDDDRMQRVITAAIEYVAKAVGSYAVTDSVLADCVTACAADLYNARDARLGVMNVGDGTLESYRVSSDPLRSVWPKLNAAGVATGGLVIA